MNTYVRVSISLAVVALVASIVALSVRDHFGDTPDFTTAGEGLAGNRPSTESDGLMTDWRLRGEPASGRLPARPARNTTTPAWTSYSDSHFGYSLDYPAGWIIRPPTEVGGAPTFYNHDPQIFDEQLATSHELPDGFSKIEIVVEDNPLQLPLDQWLREKFQDFDIDPNTPIKPIEDSTYPAIEFEAVDEYGAISLSRYIAVGSNVYIVSMSSTDDRDRSMFNSVANSFRMQR